MMNHTEKEIAKQLLDIKAVFLRPNEPFTWASGIKSPIYCDNRLMLSYPTKRDKVIQAFVNLIRTHYPDAEMIMGTATAGIPWAAWVADHLQLAMGYVRSSSKKHGKENKIEGCIKKGQKVIVVEDLISTGGSVKGVVESLREAGCEVLGIVAIFTYLLPDASQLLSTLDVDCKTLSNYDVLVDVALENHYIQSSDLAKLKAWKQDPHDEKWMIQEM